MNRLNKDGKFIYEEIKDLEEIKEFMEFFEENGEFYEVFYKVFFKKNGEIYENIFETNKIINNWKINSKDGKIFLEYEYISLPRNNREKNDLVDKLLVKNLEKFGKTELKLKLIQTNRHTLNPPERYIILEISPDCQLNNVITKLKRQKQEYQYKLEELGCKVKQQNE